MRKGILSRWLQNQSLRRKMIYIVIFSCFLLLSVNYVVLQMGKDGSRAYYKNMRVEVPGFIQENTIETTGAGDTFMGSCLHFILERGFDELKEDDLREMLIFANAAASIITTRKGALKVMPAEEEIYRLICSCR